MSKDVVCHSERSEESISALLVQCSLLFLPAAGFVRFANGAYQGTAAIYLGSSLMVVGVPATLWYKDNEFWCIRDNWVNSCWLGVVRLASVVSEVLTL